MSKQVRVYLMDILEAIEEIEQFTQEMTFEQFINNKLVIRGVTMDFAIIGEAAKHVPQEIKRKVGQVPWKQMAGIRDKIIHGYAYIQLSVLWDAVKLDLPVLKPLIKELLESDFEE
jgi:uncharacterized protein with HEPN domain